MSSLYHCRAHDYWFEGGRECPECLREKRTDAAGMEILEVFQGADKPAGAWSRQEAGSHYTDMAIQPFEYSMKNKLDPLQHTAIKYITRFRQKGGIEDLKKAIHCVEMLMEFEYGPGSSNPV